ncbi:MAG: hypothetical protein LUO80_03635, partial [Methylococcaceae bacterium]|nr:hypothetical protein [Methylococcaceae bacterium]
MSNVLHLFWRPMSGDDFLQFGDFHLWVETPKPARTQSGQRHPRHLEAKPLADWLQTALSQPVISPAQLEPLELHLPAVNAQPLPCPELLS